MPWYIYHALKQLFPSGRFFSFFSLMSIVGVMLGVCVLVIVQSVMNGFGEGIRSRLVETQGDIRIRSDEVVYDWEEQAELLLSEEYVIGVAPFAEGVVMLQHGNRPQFPMIRGIDPIAEQGVIPLQKFLTFGNLDEFDDDGVFLGEGLARTLTFGNLDEFDDDGVFLGEGLARTLKAGPGSVVEVFTPLMLERLKQDEVLLPREFTVIGLFRTGSPQVDGNTMISTLRVMQELYGLEDGVHGLVLKLRPGAKADQFANDLEGRVLRPGLRAISWIDSNREFLFVIEQEKRVISFIIIFIILVASFSIAIALMMAVLRKTREIGLLVAMGGRPHQVAYSFCFQGFVIGTLGTAVGIALAILCLHYRSPILAAYAWLTNSQVNFLGQYDVYEIPVHYLMSDFVVVTCFAVVISTLAGLLPALRAARLKPADALRSE